MALSPRTLRPSSNWTPKSISGLALWLDASSTGDLYTTDAGPVTAVSSPTQISGCVLWLDGADSSAASMTLNGSLVETWKDKSGSGNNATATSTARPTLTGGGLNGRSVVTFNGTANAMEIAANAAFNSNDLTYFVVFRQSSAANKGVYTKSNATVGSNGFALVTRSDPSVWLLQKNNGSVQVLAVASSPHAQARIYTVTSSATANGYQDGMLAQTASSAADHSLVQRVMVGSRDASEYFNGYIAEVIHYNRALSRSEVAQVELWLAVKWGISSVHKPASEELTAVSSPTELGSCALWLDASDLTSITKDGSNLVSQWNDKSGNGRNATASGSNRPTHGAVTQNGRALLSFDGSSTQMQIDSTFLITSNATILAVARYNSGAYGAIISSKGSGDTSPSLQHFNGNWQINHSGNQSAIGSQANYAVLSGTILAGATSAYANGMLQDSDASSGTLSSDATKTYIGTYRAAVSNVLNGTVGEIIVFNTALSTTDRLRVEAYLASKWGITGVPVATPSVGYWGDKSGNARHATQSTAGSRPTISATALNGKKQLGLISQHLRGPSTTWTGSASIYWVGRTGQSANGAFVFGDGTTDQTDGFHAGWLNAAGVGAYGNGWQSGNAPRAESPSAWRNADIVAGVTLSSTEAIARVNGATTNTTAALTGSLSQSAAAQFYIGRESSGTWNNINGSLAELLIYQPALNASQRLRLERYLAAKYGITLAPQVPNADAQDWVNRVYANGGSVSSSTAASVSAFCDSIDSVSGLRVCFYRLNLFCGGTSGTTAGLAACLVPLYRGPSLGGTQYGNATDTNVGPFVVGDYAETGLSAGSGKYLRTGVTQANVGVACHLAFYDCAKATNAYANRIGSRGATDTHEHALTNLDVATTMDYGSSAVAGNQRARATGYTQTGAFWLGVNPSATSAILYKNGVSAVTATPSARTAQNLDYWVFALNNNGSLDSGMTTGRSGGYSIGLSMDATQAAAYYTAMQAFQTALGRNV